MASLFRHTSAVFAGGVRFEGAASRSSSAAFAEAFTYVACELHWVESMLDVLFVIVMAASFAGALAYVVGCARL